MKGTASSSSNHWDTASSRTDGANGRKDSRRLSSHLELPSCQADGDRTQLTDCRALAAPIPCALETNRPPCRQQSLRQYADKVPPRPSFPRSCIRLATTACGAPKA